jgi:hypothetical protein
VSGKPRLIENSSPPQSDDPGSASTPGSDRIDARLVDRILRWLDALNAALKPEEMDQLGFRLRSRLITYNPAPIARWIAFARSCSRYGFRMITAPSLVWSFHLV